MCRKNGEKAAPKERGKNISFWGGQALIINNLTGPGLVVLGAAYQGGGWASSTLVVIIVGIISILGCGMLARAMAHVRGNEKFQGSIEYTNLCRAVFPMWLYYGIMVAFLLFFQFSNISQIVESAQVLDYLLLVAFNKTCALEMTPDLQFECITHNPSMGLSDSPFGATKIVISLGMILTLAISLPLGYVNLDDNIWFQYFSAVVMIVIWLEWSGQSIVDGQNFTQVAAFASNQYQVFGNILFNYAVVVSIPSWINEKKPEASVNWTIWGCGVTTIFMYLTLGWLSAAGDGINYQAETGTGSVDLLTIFSSVATPFVTRLMVYLFVITLVSGIPVWSIIIRYNLVQDGICSEPVANIFAVVLPFVVSIFFYSGSLLNEIVNIVGFLLCVPLNFIIPGYLYILVLRNPDKPFCTLPEAQQDHAGIASLKDLSSYAANSDNDSDDDGARAKAITAGMVEEDPCAHEKRHTKKSSGSCRTGLKANLLDRDGDAAYESQGSYCDHDHTTDLDLRAQTEHGLLRSDYYVLPPSWSVRTKELIAQMVIWVPTAMCIPAIILWGLESFTSFKG